MDDELKELKKEVKELKKSQLDMEKYFNTEHDPKLNRIIAWIKKIEQRIK